MATETRTIDDVEVKDKLAIVHLAFRHGSKAGVPLCGRDGPGTWMPKFVPSSCTVCSAIARGMGYDEDARIQEYLRAD